MELVQGCRNRQELTRLKKDLDRRKARILPLSEAISKRAAELVESHAASDGLMLADALIAATAIEQGLSLASGNVKHFGVVQGLELVVFEV